LTPIHDPNNKELIGYDVSNKLNDCPEFEQGWDTILFILSNNTYTNWFKGPDGDHWRIYTDDEFLGEGFSTPEVVQYATELNCKI
jgi:hypothetical protein